jgi:hypothetical protein
VDHIGLKFTWEVLDDEGIVRALVDANPATDAQALRNVRLASVVVHDDAFLPVSDRWAKIVAFVVALLGLTVVFLQNRNTHATTGPSFRKLYFVSPAGRRTDPAETTVEVLK